jgi:hypothetical protein
VRAALTAHGSPLLSYIDFSMPSNFLITDVTQKRLKQ